MLDLSKLEALKFPEKEIEISIMGVPQKIIISAYGDDVSLQVADINANRPDDGELRIRKLLLTSCVKGMDEKSADLLLRKAGKEAKTILNEIFDLNDQFDSERDRLRELAEKN